MAQVSTTLRCIRECTKTLQEMERTFTEKFFVNSPQSKTWDLYTKLDLTINKWSNSLHRQEETIDVFAQAMGYRASESSLISLKLEGIKEAQS